MNDPPTAEIEALGRLPPAKRRRVELAIAHQDEINAAMARHPGGAGPLPHEWLASQGVETVSPGELLDLRHFQDALDLVLAERASRAAAEANAARRMEHEALHAGAPGGFIGHGNELHPRTGHKASGVTPHCHSGRCAQGCGEPCADDAEYLTGDDLTRHLLAARVAIIERGRA